MQVFLLQTMTKPCLSCSFPGGAPSLQVRFPRPHGLEQHSLETLALDFLCLAADFLHLVSRWRPLSCNPRMFSLSFLKAFKIVKNAHRHALKWISFFYFFNFNTHSWPLDSDPRLLQSFERAHCFILFLYFLDVPLSHDMIYLHFMCLFIELLE